MQLSVEVQWIGDVAVLRCKGRIVLGPEVTALQTELGKVTPLTKQVVLHMEEVTFLDSVGLGAVVRQFGGLQATGGDLKLCHVPPILVQVFQVTNLLRILPVYETEAEAVAAFAKGPHYHKETASDGKTKIVCIDPSHDLLAYLSALLKRSGYEVVTTRNPADALLFVRITKPHVLICGPGLQTNEQAMSRLAEIKQKVQMLHLPADFSTGDAGQAGVDLVTRLQTLLSSQQS